MKSRRWHVLASWGSGALLTITLIGCGPDSPPPDGGQMGPPVVFDAGLRQDAGTPTVDGGQAEREAVCATFCSKLFECGYFPQAGFHPPGFSTSDCVYQCSVLSGFPPPARRECVAGASCACDGGGCHTVDTCFASDGGF